MKADTKTKPSADDTKPNGCPTYAAKRVGRWVRVMRANISPRSASMSCRRAISAPYGQPPYAAHYMLDRCRRDFTRGARRYRCNRLLTGPQRAGDGHGHVAHLKRLAEHRPNAGAACFFGQRCAAVAAYQDDRHIGAHRSNRASELGAGHA